MLIECRARRKGNHINPEGGTKLKLFGKHYHFKPRPDLVKENDDPERHLCEIKDEKAIERLLSIPEAYNKAGLPPKLKAPAKAAEATGQPAITTELIDDEDTLGAKDVTEVDPLAGAKEQHAIWIEETLAQPTKTLAKMDLSELDDDLLVSVLEAEQAGAGRTTVAKLIASEQAVRAAKASGANAGEGQAESDKD